MGARGGQGRHLDVVKVYGGRAGRRHVDLLKSVDQVALGYVSALTVRLRERHLQGAHELAIRPHVRLLSELVDGEVETLSW